MAYIFPYLDDKNFLKKFNKEKLKEQYVKLVVLNMKEYPIQEIQGKVIGGSFNLDGSSGMRRTANLSMVIGNQERYSSYELLGMNKKIEVFIGFINTTKEYQNYPIIWFPMGVYIVISLNIAHSETGITISVDLHDKMALLNGECGGILPASVIFSQREDIDENGQTQIIQPTIYQIIQQLVNHFGGEQLGKIIISDLDNKIKKVMKWTGSTPLYYYKGENDSVSSFYLTSKDSEKGEPNEVFQYGQDIGYILTDFVYPGELIGNAGDTVVTILDKIKSVLGNYQYFYDINGNFRFQEIKNYLNTSYSTLIANQANSLNSYLVDYATAKSVYTFEDGEIIKTYNNTPQYQLIKNDFVIWGKRKSTDGVEIPIRYHLAIDQKPKLSGESYSLTFYIDEDDEIEKARKSVETDLENEKVTIVPTDWRTQLYAAGVVSDPLGLDNNYYYTQLKNEWPKLYDIKKGDFFQQVKENPSSIDFFLDLIDTPAAISRFSVKNIGRRTLTLVDDSINCIFEPTYPDIIIIEAGNDDQTSSFRAECEKRKLEYAQVSSQIYSLLAGGGILRSAYEEIRKELYQYTTYNEQISITALPIFYLEPNTRITVRDSESKIYGDYMIKTISLPLDINGTMNITCGKALERI